MTEREAFEAWAREYGYDIDEPYDPAHADAWLGWNARAARAPTAQAVPLLSEDELLTMWAGDRPRPTLGKNKVLAYGRQVEQAVRAKLGVAAPMTDDTALIRQMFWVLDKTEHDQTCDVLDLDENGNHKACSCGLEAAHAAARNRLGIVGKEGA